MGRRRPGWCCGLATVRSAVRPRRAGPGCRAGHPVARPGVSGYGRTVTRCLLQGVRIARSKIAPGPVSPGALVHNLAILLLTPQLKAGTRDASDVAMHAGQLTVSVETVRG